MTNFYTGYIRLVETEMSIDTVADNSYDLSVNQFAARDNVIDYFYFVDGGGAQIDAGAGTVVITFSAGGDIFNTITDGSFNAADARLLTRGKPNGFGRVSKVRVTLAGVTVAAGFRMLISQSVS